MNDKTNILALLAAKKAAREEQIKEADTLIRDHEEDARNLAKPLAHVEAAKEGAETLLDSYVPNSLKDKLARLKEVQASTQFQNAVQQSIEANAAKFADKPLPQAVKPALVPAPLHPAPHKPMSLAEKIAARKAAEAEKAMAEDASETLPSSVTPEINEAIFVDHQAKPPVRPDPKVLSMPALKPKPVHVVEVSGKWLTIEELAAEIKRVSAIIDKGLKSQALLAKLAYLQERLVEIETQKDLEEEAMAPAAGTVTEAVKGNADEAPADVEHVVEDQPPVYQGAFSLSIELNERQLMAKEMALSGKSFCLIGAAGTGKTTSQRSVAEALLDSDRLHTTTYKVQGLGNNNRVEGPSFVACAFTRRASGNLARAIHKNPRLEEALRFNIMTVHNLLEFEPVYFYDAEKERDSMRFEPKKTASDPLHITHLAIEEASMLGLDLWAQLYDAMPEGVQIIFIGDINQLPPVFGASILNYALVQLPVIELIEVYRQKGDSGILHNAHNVLAGRGIEEGNGVTVIRGNSTQQVGQERMSQALGQMFKAWHQSNDYRPEEDMILSPFNKQALGTDNMNKWIAQFLGEKRNAIVYEVLAGFNKHYLAVGDRVMVNKQDGYIVQIKNNAQYQGQEPQLPGSDLSRFGMRIIGAGGDNIDELEDVLLGYANFDLEELAQQQAERKMQASHVVDVLLESGQTVTLSATGDFGPQVFSLGYVLTVHKAQGCEFRKVFLLLHKDHSVMLSRELFYTAITRARDELVIVAKDWIIEKAIKTQRIKGNCLEDKIEYFNSGAVDMIGGISCTK